MDIPHWKDVMLTPIFTDQGVDCYELEGGEFLNDYYIVSEAETRKLMNHPEIVGYEVYRCLINATSQMMYYLKEKKKITSANILSILRGALNYPLEESCYREHIRVHDISFMSCERVFKNQEMTGLAVKYSKLTAVPDSTLMIGDIIASGETLIYCLKEVIDFYRRENVQLRNILFFTIGGTKGIKILEEKLGHSTELTFEEWLEDCHYQNIPMEEATWLYRQEKGYIESLKDITLEEIASTRIREFTKTLKKYIF